MSEDDEKKGSFIKALGVGIILTLLVEIGLGLSLDVKNDLVARFMMVMSGVAVILIVSFIGRSFFKSALAGLLTVLVSFVGPFLLPDFFTSMFPFISSVVPSLEVFLELLKSQGTGGTTVETMALYLQYAFVIDIGLALIIATVAGIGVIRVVGMFSKKSGIGGILLGVFGILFLITGAFILPWMFTGVSGVFQMGIGLANGGIYLGQGMDAMGSNISTANIDNASFYFDEANKWFEQARTVLNGIKGLGMFWIASLAMPDYAPLIDNGEIVLDAGVDLVQAVGPFVSAMAYLNDGFQKAGGSFAGSTSSTSLSLLQAQSDFDKGIEMIEIAFANITEATKYIQSALTKLENLDRAKLEQSLADSGVQGTEQVSIIFDAITLLNSTIDVLNVLINPLQNSPKAPLIHLLYGMNALSKAGDVIGNSTNFAGTSDLFGDVVSNLTVIKDALNTPTLVSFRNLDTSGFDPSLSDIQSQVAGAFNFFDDAADVAIGFGNFGQQIVPILATMNETLGILNDPNLDLLTIDDATYDTAISNLKDMANQSSALVVTAQGIETSVSRMENRSVGDYYGSLGSAAGEFANEFKGFDLVLNSKNFVYVANGLAEVFEMAKLLKKVQLSIQYITDDLNSIQNETDPVQVALKLQAVQASVQANLTLVDSTLNTTKVHLTQAKGNFSKAISEGGMTQLGNIDTVLAEIEVHITNIQGDNGLNKLETIMNDPATYVTTNGADQTKTDMSDAVNYILSELDATTQAISTLSIAK